MKLLRIKDNSQQKKDAFSQVARLTGKIADKTLEQLERDGHIAVKITPSQKLSVKAYSYFLKP